jgi:hypothetical protein
MHAQTTSPDREWKNYRDDGPGSFPACRSHPSVSRLREGVASLLTTSRFPQHPKLSKDSVIPVAFLLTQQITCPSILTFPFLFSPVPFVFRTHEIPNPRRHQFIVYLFIQVHFLILSSWGLSLQKTMPLTTSVPSVGRMASKCAVGRSWEGQMLTSMTCGS